MPFIRVAPQVVEFALHGVHTNAREITNMWHTTIELTGDRVTNINAVAIRLRDAWQSEILDVVSDNYTFTGLTWIDLNSDDGATGGQSPNGALPIVGSRAGTAISPQVAALVHKRTTSTRTERDGRMYLAPVSTSDLSENGILTAGAVTAYNTATAAFHTAVDDAGPPAVTSVVAHFQIPPGDPPPTPVIVTGTSSFITSLPVDTRGATQRRRNRD